MAAPTTQIFGRVVCDNVRVPRAFSSNAAYAWGPFRVRLPKNVTIRATLVQSVQQRSFGKTLTTFKEIDVFSGLTKVDDELAKLANGKKIRHLHKEKSIREEHKQPAVRSFEENKILWKEHEKLEEKISYPWAELPGNAPVVLTWSDLLGNRVSVEPFSWALSRISLDDDRS